MRPLAVLAPLLFLLPGASAGHCTTWSTSVTDDSQIVVDFGSDLLVHYIAIDRDTGEGSLYSIWLYREYNGIPGLQRGDEMRDDTCHGLMESDGFHF